MQNKVKDDKTQASLMSQTKEDETKADPTECKGSSEFNMVFWDIEVIKNLPIWVEPILVQQTNYSECLAPLPMKMYWCC